MAPVADRTEGANIGSLTDGSVGRARRRHKKTEGEEGEEGKRRGGEGRGAGPVSARWRARPRNFSVVFRGPWSSGPEMKAEPPLNAAAGLRSKIPLLPEHPKAKNVRLYMYAPRRAATSRHFSPSRSARSSTRHSRHTRFSPFFFLFILFYFRPPPTTSSSPLSSSLSRALELSLSSSRADFLEFVSSPRSSSPPRRPLSSSFIPSVFSPPLPSPRTVSWESGPPSIDPPEPPYTQIDRHPWARCSRPAITLARSLARKIRGAVGPVRTRRLRFCALMPPPSSSFSFSSNFLSPPVRRFNGPMRERISMISCSLAEERPRFWGGLVRCLDRSEGFDCCSIERGDGKRERERREREMFWI